MIFLALAILIIFSGFLVGLGKQKALKISKAFFFVGIETLLGCLLFELLTLVFFMLPLEKMLSDGAGSIFSMILVIAIINGIILYWLNRFLNVKFKISSQVQVLSEYMIQWGLIYVTVYQVMFDNFLSVLKSEHFKASDISALNLTDPTDLIILVLPALISVWIALVLSRLKNDTL